MKGRVVIVGPEGYHTQFAYATSINVYDVDVRLTEGLGNAIQGPRLMGDQHDDPEGRCPCYRRNSALILYREAIQGNLR